MSKRWTWMCLCAALACGERDIPVKTVTVSGRIRKDALGFAGGVKVEVRYADGSLPGYDATSDSAGGFAVVAPARDEVYFRCTSSGCAPTNSRFFTTSESALEGVELWVLTLAGRASAGAGAATATGKTADLSSKGFVVGILYDAGGHSVMGAKVTVSPPDAETGIAYVDKDGAYGTLPFTTGMLSTVQFAAVNVLPGEFELTQDVDPTSARAMSAANEVTAVILRGLPVYCGVVGGVVDDQEAVVPGASVQAYDEPGALLAGTVTDEDGIFVLTGLTEGTEFHLRAEAGAGYVPGNTRYYLIGSEPVIGVAVPLLSDTYYDSVLTQMETDLEFTRQASKGLLAARLTNTAGAPVVKETVSMNPAGGVPGYVDSAGAYESGAVDYTDTQNVASGPQWLAANVDPGTVELEQSMDAGTVKLPSRADEFTYVDIEGLPRRVIISGTVKDENDVAVSGAAVTVYGTSITANTGGAGGFALTGRILAGSRVTLRIVESVTHRTTNTPYIDLPNSNVALGVIPLVSETYFQTQVGLIEAANTGLTVDTAGCGVITGVVKDLQIPAITLGTGMVVGAQVSLAPPGGFVDYVNDAGEFGNPATDENASGLFMFAAVNVDPGNVTVTEDWDSTGLDCPVRAGEITLASFENLTPQNHFYGRVIGESGPLEGASVIAYDEEWNEMDSATTDASGNWEIKGLRAFQRLYLSTTPVGYVTTNTPYYDVEYTDFGLPAVRVVLSPFGETFRSQLVPAWTTYKEAPDTSSCGVLMGDLKSGGSKLAGHEAWRSGFSAEAGYLDNGGAFGGPPTVANPQLGGGPAPQFHIFDVTPGNYVLEQSGDGKLTRVPARAGEYTHAVVWLITAGATIDISGNVEDENGDPVAGATVRISGTGPSDVSIADGSYTLSGIPQRSTVAMSVSKDGETYNIPYIETGALDLTRDLIFPTPGLADILRLRFEAGVGELDAENKGIVFGLVTDVAFRPLAGVKVALSPSAGDTAYFDEYLRAVAPSTTKDAWPQFMIGNVEPGDAVITQDANWQRLELPCRAGEYTLVWFWLLK